MSTRKALNGSKRAGVPACKIIVEKHADGYVAYPLGLNGVVVGQGDTYDAVLNDIRSAIRFHVATFGKKAFRDDSPVLEAFIAEAEITA